MMSKVKMIEYLAYVQGMVFFQKGITEPQFREPWETAHDMLQNVIEELRNSDKKEHSVFISRMDGGDENETD